MVSFAGKERMMELGVVIGMGVWLLIAGVVFLVGVRK